MDRMNSKSDLVRLKESLRPKEPQSSRKYRFESFTERIAKIKIDPIRQERPKDASLDSENLDSSFFVSNLTYSAEHNLSETFADFVRVARPLAQSLHQVVHNQTKLVELLIEYLDKEDSLCLDSLFDLVLNLARDLGSKFEAHYEKSLKSIIRLASHHADVTVVEKSFTTLASLFKLLSNLLVPDLRPTFALLEPLLGRERQKVHVVRFAGEALAFLVRKVAQRHTRYPERLRDLCDYILNRWRESQTSGSNTELFKYGLMTLFSSAIKGSNRSLSVYGQEIIVTLLTSPSIVDFLEPLRGVVTNVLHHVEDQCPDLDMIAQTLTQVLGAHNPDRKLEKQQAMELLSIFVCVRGGKRIPYWKPWIEVFLNISQELSDHEDNESAALCGAAIFASADIDDLLSSSADLLRSLYRLRSVYFRFACILHENNSERFNRFVRIHFQKQSTENWDLSKAPLDAAELLAFQSIGACPDRPSSGSVDDWIAALVGFRLDSGFSLEGRKHAGYEILTRQKVRTADLGPLLREIQEVNSSTIQNDNQSGSRTLFVGSMLAYVLGVFRVEDMSDILPWILSQSFLTAPFYLDNTLRIALSCRANGVDGILSPESSLLLPNLSCPSSQLRESTLKLLLAFLADNADSGLRRMLELCLKIENTERTFDNARTVSMYIRELSSLSLALAEGHFGRSIAVHFLLGILHYGLNPLKDDAIEGLRIICADKLCSDLLAQTLSKWLSVSAIPESTPSTYDSAKVSTEFDCTNYAKWRELHQKIRTRFAEPTATLDELFQKKHVSEQLEDSTCFTKALRLFKSLPAIFESRSRIFAPLFLEILSKTTESLTSKEDALSENDALDQPLVVSNVHSSRLQKKIVLDILSNCQNPPVLYRAPALYEAILDLLMDGELETQKSALMAILKWKQPQITTYSENLLNLLDPARFVDELSSFLGGEESNIRPEHHDTLLPVLLRLLYGRLTSRSGGASHDSLAQSKRRLLGLRILASRPQKLFLKEFTKLALGTLAEVHFAEGSLVPPSSVPSPRVQFGTMNMLSSTLDVLKERSSDLGEVPIAAASWVLNHQAQNSVAEPINSLERSVRQMAMNCLSQFYRHCEPELCHLSMEFVHRDFVVSKLSNFASESTESVSGVLRLLAAFANNRAGISYLLDGEHSSWDILLQCIANQKTKLVVKDFIFTEILLPVAQIFEYETPGTLISHGGTISSELLQRKVHGTFSTLRQVIERHEQGELIKPATELMLHLTSLVRSHAESEIAIQFFCSLLQQSPKRVSFVLKGRALGPLEKCLCLSISEIDEHMFMNIFKTLSALYDYFLDKPSREALSSALLTLVQAQEDLTRAVKICKDLNSTLGDQFDSIDYDKRDRAFEAILHENLSTYSELQLLPILHNLAFFLRSSDDLSVEQSAGLALRNFVSIFGKKAVEDIDDNGTRRLFVDVLIPSLHAMVLNTHEVVRAEALSVIAQIVKYAATVARWVDLAPLLVDNDEEASFFTNVLHIQQHRRLRALKRLSSIARESGFRQDNVMQIFVPLLDHFIFRPSESANAHALTLESINAMVDLMHCVDFRQWLNLFQKYLGRFKSTENEAKVIIRLFEALIKSLAESYIDGAKIDAQDTTENHDYVVKESDNLARAVPSSEKLHKMLSRRILPVLTQYMRVKNEDTTELRIQLSVPLVRMLQLFPEAIFTETLPPLLTDISQILRSRSQETRDLVRKCLSEISIICGEQYFKFLVEELKTALTRGYQVHVLSFTLHSLLVEVAPQYPYGALDGAVPVISTILLDDIFGMTGQEKDAEGYTNKMKEVKGRKSVDSVTILSKICNLSAVSRLIANLRPFLREASNNRQLKKAQEIMQRISNGLVQNPGIKTAEALVLCHELLLSESGSFPLRSTPKSPARAGIPIESLDRSTHKDAPSSHLVIFAYDLLRNIVNRSEELNSPKYLGRFVPILNDHLLDSSTEIKASVLRVLTQIIGLQIAEFEVGAPVYIKEALRSIDDREALGTVLGQASLKFLTAISKERPSVTFRDSDLANLLNNLKQDLENTSRQSSSFAFLKTIIARKFLNVELYVIMDKVATIMVTSQSMETRELSRSCFVQFFLNYPQGKGRLNKTITFLVKNIDYEHAEGRRSVMECIHALASRQNSDITQQLISALFLPLAMSVCNDENSECRKMAAHLCQSLFAKADALRAKNIMDVLAAWSDAEQSTKVLIRLALHLYAMLVDPESNHFQTVLPSLCAKCTYMVTEEQFNGQDDWEIIYYSLKLMQKITLFPEQVLESQSVTIPWPVIIKKVSFPHVWVRTVASQLVEQLLSSLSLSAQAESGPIDSEAVVLARPDGSKLLLRDLMRLCKSSLHALSLPSITSELALQVVQNIALVAQLAGHVHIFQDTSTAEDLPTQGHDALATGSSTGTIATALFDAITLIIRKESASLTTDGLSPRSACLRLCALLCTKLELEQIEPSLNKILKALYNLTDKSIAVPFSASELVRTELENLSGNATELLEVLQIKFGAKYIDIMAKISRETRETRNDRRIKRRREQASGGEHLSQVKRKKIERQKQSRKLKSQEQRGNRRGW